MLVSLMSKYWTNTVSVYFTECTMVSAQEMVLCAVQNVQQRKSVRVQSMT